MEHYSLTDNDIDFCQLFVYGGFGVAGDILKCHEEAFGITDKKSARRLYSKPEIKDKIKELIESFKDNEELRTLALQIQITDTLTKVMREASTDVYATPKGHKLSPAPLRSVSVNAAKALYDMHTKSSKHTLQIEGDAGIVFNVVVPTAKENEKT